MVRAVIIDDEKWVRNNIRNRIEEHFSSEIQIIGEATSIVESIALIEKSKPSLLFLDIELKDGYSFEIFEKIKDKTFHIIFITGFDEHAIKAIKIGALDYILKPIDVDEFITATKKAIDKIETEDLKEQLKVANNYFKGLDKKQIVLKTHETNYIVKEEAIYYCKSDGNYTTFYTNLDQKIMISKSMKKVEEILSKDTFIKTHQSYLVNKNYVTSYTKDGYLILNTNIKIPVSSRRREFINKMIFN